MEQAKCKNIYIEKHDYDDENIRLITLLSYIVNCFTILIWKKIVTKKWNVQTMFNYMTDVEVWIKLALVQI